MDPALLAILACPDSHHAPLTASAAGVDPPTLTCTQCHRVFSVRDGIPVLLLDEATGGPATDDGVDPGPSSTG